LNRKSISCTITYHQCWNLQTVVTGV